MSSDEKKLFHSETEEHRVAVGKCMTTSDGRLTETEYCILKITFSDYLK